MTITPSIIVSSSRHRSTLLAMFLLFLAESGEAFSPGVSSTFIGREPGVPATSKSTPPVLIQPSSLGGIHRRLRLPPSSLHRGGGGTSDNNTPATLPLLLPDGAAASSGVIGGQQRQSAKYQENRGLSMSSVAISSGTEYIYPLDRKFQLFANYSKEFFGLGTRTHLINGLASLAVLSWFALTKGRRTCSAMSSFALFFGFTGLFVDNMINAAGKFVGKGRKLRRLTKLRLMFHGGGVPLLIIPIVEAAFFQGLLKAKVASKLITGCTAFAIFEFFHWLTYDSNKFNVVDNRESPHHSAHYLSGTLTYTSGKILQCVLPAAFLSLFEVTIGSLLIKKSLAGAFMLTSGLVSLFSCSNPKRPDIQLYGETVAIGLLWATAACV